VRANVSVSMSMGISVGVRINVSVSIMGWLRLVGSLKLQVSSAEYCLLHRAVLQKGPINLKSLLIVATP